MEQVAHVDRRRLQVQSGALCHSEGTVVQRVHRRGQEEDGP